MYDPRYPFFERLSGVLDIIQIASPDILCLQEVTDEMLDQLLSSPVIRSIFAYSSRDPCSSMENCRNVVILSKEGFQFSWSTLNIRSKQKPASLARFDFDNDVSFAVASIHLSAGHFADLERRKLLEFQTLLDRVKTEVDRRPVFIAGDSNFLNTFKPHDCGRDVWDECHPDASEGEGDTFDPVRNSLAAPPDRLDRSAKRYDRIWLLNDSRRIQFVPITAEILGHEHTNASDHYLLTATFRFAGRGVKTISETSHPVIGLSSAPTSFSDFDLQIYCSEAGHIPSDEENTRRADAFNKLRKCLTSHLEGGSSGIQLIVQPVGSFALGIHSSSSDLDCTVVGNLPSSTFWQYILERIHIQLQEGKASVQVVRFIKGATVKVLELLINDIKMDVQYCCAPAIASRFVIMDSMISYLISR
jgi:endonuclease/exonuclease/phosphatase family metal-dependent hydrolase